MIDPKRKSKLTPQEIDLPVIEAEVPKGREAEEEAAKQADEAYWKDMERRLKEPNA